MRKLMFGAGIATMVALMLFVVSPMPAAAQAEGSGTAGGGQAVFMAQKCNMCHDVSTVGITATAKSEKVKGGDIVNLGENAEFWAKYLKKEVEYEGKKHSKGYTGTDADLKVLTEWMMAQKK